MHRTRIFVLAGLALALWPSVAAAQEPPTPDKARVQLGPLSFTPMLVVSNVGIDSNPSDDPTNPQQDFTAQVGPGVTAWFHAGRLLLTDKSALEWMYFKRQTKQRSANLQQNERFDLALGLLTPHLEADYSRTRQRPTLDLDVRVRRVTQTVNGGVVLHLGPMTSIDLAAEERHERSDHDQFDGIDLGNELTHDTSMKSVRFDKILTPLTTFRVIATTQRVRFPFESLRNNDSNAVTVGVSLKPLALISGDIAVGVRLFNALSPLVPDYNGLIARASATYTVHDSMQINPTFNRDVDYSFDPESPYFLSTNSGVTVTQALGTFWDVRARYQHASLAYRAFAQSVIPAHSDSGNSVGAGIGRKLPNGIRIGFDVDHVSRQSTIDGRQFGGYRVGGSFSYGS